MIDTREELIGALKEAAEIEHGLMIQYLFAALSLKKRADEGLTAAQQAQVRVWEANILDVAVSEMGHLGTVFNLLSAIGANPHLDRPPFPQTTDWYPFPFNLRRFSEKALYGFQIFELPRGVDPPRAPGAALAAVAPDPLVYSRVGELYQQISDAFASLPEQGLFIGPADAQAAEEWSIPVRVSRVTSRATAVDAIKKIIEDGEGTPTVTVNSHYARFTAMREALNQAGGFEAARDVVLNPQTRDWRGAGEGTRITNTVALPVAELFNSVYALMLTLLYQYFAYGGESEAQREALRSGAARMMSTGIRPLSEILTDLPAGADDDPARAGPPFELYGEIEASPFKEARWTMLFERFDAVQAEAKLLGREVPRIATIGETISFIRRDIARVASEAVG